MPKAPRAPRLKFGDATPEPLTHGLATGGPSAGLISTKAGAVFGSHGMQRESIMRCLTILNLNQL